MRSSKHKLFERPLMRAVTITCALGLSSTLVVAGASAATGPLVAKSDSTGGVGGHAPTSKMVAPKAANPMDISNPPVALGPRPASFALQDANGSWYDTGTEVVGTRSLAVAL